MKTFLLTTISLLFLFTPTVYGSEYPGDPSDFNDPKCGKINDLSVFAPDACQTKTEVHGQRLPDIVIENPGGPPTVIKNPNVRFDPLDTSSGQNLKIPTGKSDLEQWIGRTYTGEEITDDMSCDDIVEKVLSISSPAQTHTGVWARLLTPDDSVPDALRVRCEEIKAMYTTKSLARVDTHFDSPDTPAADCAIPREALIATPTLGPAIAANLIAQWLRPPNYEEVENYALDQLNQYQNEHQTVSMCPTQNGTNIRLVANSDPSPAPQPPPPEVTPYLDPGRCVDGNCDTVKELDSEICYLGNQVEPARRTLELGTVPLRDEGYPIDIVTRDPALGGGIIFTEPPSNGSTRRFDLNTVTAYLYFPYTAGPQELNNPLWNTKRFAPGEGDEWNYKGSVLGSNTNEGGEVLAETANKNDSKWFGLGHTVALQASSCRAGKSPDQLAANPLECGPIVGYIEGSATNIKRPGIDYEPEPAKEPPPPPDYVPEFSDPDCKACTPTAESGLSQVLLDLLQEAGSKYNVPANVLLGIMRLESGHRGQGKPVYQFSDAEVQQAIADKDPYCVRNEWCAAGPFQMLTSPNDPNISRSDFKKQWGSCDKWPGFDVWSTYKDASGSSSPHPCNLRDAAFAAAKHVRYRSNYRREKLGKSVPEECGDWDYDAARDGWYTYQGNCSNNYCETARQFLNNVCVDSSITQP